MLWSTVSPGIKAIPALPGFSSPKTTRRSPDLIWNRSRAFLGRTICPRSPTLTVPKRCLPLGGIGIFPIWLQPVLSRPLFPLLPPENIYDTGAGQLSSEKSDLFVFSCISNLLAHIIPCLCYISTNRNKQKMCVLVAVASNIRNSSAPLNRYMQNPFKIACGNGILHS